MKYYAGIDVGSLTADAVIIDGKGNIVGYEIIPTGNNSRSAGSVALKQALSKTKLKMEKLEGIFSTGYSRGRVLEANDSKTEIACHAKGALHILPTVRTIIDIGGQDSKAIRVGSGGRVINFSMNDKCAAGTGRFLEVMAVALNIPLDQMGEKAMAAKEELNISSICTVFAESEVVSLISQGKEPADIALAVSRAIARRTAGLARRIGIEDDLIMTGGVAKNSAVVSLLAVEIGHSIKIPEEPQIIGALGAALFAMEVQ